MKKLHFFLLIFLLVVADQAIKIFIYRYWLDVRFDIIPGLFEFYPFFNSQYSYINHLFQLGWGLWIHLFIVVIGGGLFGLVYLGIRYVSTHVKLLDLSVVFILAGMICWFITILFWPEGCLDYIFLKLLFVFDLKDLFVNTGLVLWLWHAAKSSSTIKKLSFRELLGNAGKMLKELFT